MFADRISGAIAVVVAHSLVQRGNDASFQFEQESNFWYLTGIEAPDWWVIIDGASNKSWLVSPDISLPHQIFDGSLSSDEAMRISGADGVLTRDEAMTMLGDLAKKHKTVYTIGDHPHTKHFNFVINPAQKKMWTMLKRIFDDVKDCRPELAKLRAIKRPVEIEAIKNVVKLTTNAFENIKHKLPNLSYEYEVEAEFSYYFRKNGARGHAYDPIVASGKNACTLHYNTNNDKLSHSDLILIDIGARVGGYAADVTRTYSLGQPTERAKQVHTAVMQAHKQIINLLKPSLAVSDYQSKVDKIMKTALVSLGLMESMDDNDNYRRYFPHAISHGLGIDVHDSLGLPTEFLPGMVLTVEPGIYIPEENLGVRIEDDILITSTGHDNLSGSLSTDL